MAGSQGVFVKESLRNNSYHHKGVKYQVVSIHQKTKTRERSNIISFEEAVESLFSKIKNCQISNKNLALRLAEASVYPKLQQATTKTSLPEIHAAVNPVAGGNAWDVLEALIGTIDAPNDWSSEHNHYLYGTPKHQSEPLNER